MASCDRSLDALSRHAPCREQGHELLMIRCMLQHSGVRMLHLPPPNVLPRFPRRYAVPSTRTLITGVRPQVVTVLRSRHLTQVYIRHRKYIPRTASQSARQRPGQAIYPRQLMGRSTGPVWTGTRTTGETTQRTTWGQHTLPLSECWTGLHSASMSPSSPPLASES
jgi:hypothetical protein